MRIKLDASIFKTTMTRRLLPLLLALTTICSYGDEKTPAAAPTGDKTIEKSDLLTAEEAAEQKAEKGDHTLTELVDGLDQASLQEAFRLLRKEYIKREDLDYDFLNQAAIQGLLERLDFGAMLLTEASRSASDSPFGFYQTTLAGKIGYARLGRYSRDELDPLDEAIAAWRNDKEIGTLVLDLRSPQAQADFAIAAEILSRFRPPNELLFKIRRPDQDRPVLFSSTPSATSWSREVVVLVDSETGNVGEIIAAVLQDKQNSLVVGEQTPGLTVEYRDVPIGDDRILRYAIAEVILDGELSIFRKGVTPGLPTEPTLKAKHAVYTALDGGAAIEDYLFRQTRPRMNEAALVAGTDPELDYYLAKSNNRDTEWDTFLPSDDTLQQIIDVILSREFLDGGKWQKR